MYSSKFAKREQKSTHERWCDTMVAKAKSQRVRPAVCVMARPTKKEPTYTNYELQKMFKSLLTNQPKGAILKS